MTDGQFAHFKFTYPSINQAPDALLARAESDARAKCIEPKKFNFATVIDYYPEDEPEPGTIDVLVVVQAKEPKMSFLKRINPFNRNGTMQ